MKKSITEKDNAHQQWYDDAKDQTVETLPNFIQHILNDYTHDYGTICHALTAGGIATMWAMDKSEQGGITGFQAGCIMWEFIKNWMSLKSPLKLFNYENMLFPQYIDRFDKTINKETWLWLQEKAREFLNKENKHTHPEVVAHWQSIINGKVPFGYTIDNGE
jgi:hypothetical protein